MTSPSRFRVALGSTLCFAAIGKHAGWAVQIAGVSPFGARGESDSPPGPGPEVLSRAVLNTVLYPYYPSRMVTILREK